MKKVANDIIPVKALNINKDGLLPTSETPLYNIKGNTRINVPIALKKTT